MDPSLLRRVCRGIGGLSSHFPDEKNADIISVGIHQATTEYAAL